MGSRHLAAIVFTDIVGFTKMCEQDEELAIQLLEEHSAIVRPIVEAHDGTEIKTIGDAFMLMFRSAMDAVSCAIQIQAHMAERNAEVGTERELHMRIGIHLGDVFKRDGEKDLFGDGVNVAARVVQITGKGEICFTQQIYDQISKQIDLPIVDLGRKQVKNIQEPLHIYRMGKAGEENGEPIKQAISEEEMKTAFIEAVPVTLDRRNEDRRADENTARAFPKTLERRQTDERRAVVERRAHEERRTIQPKILKFAPPPKSKNWLHRGLSGREKVLLSLLAITALLDAGNIVANRPAVVDVASGVAESAAWRKVASDESGCHNRDARSCYAWSRRTHDPVTSDGALMQACRMGSSPACLQIRSELHLETLLPASSSK